MRHHDHQHGDSEHEGAAHHRAPELDPLTMKAVTAGRTDVLGPSAVLGLQRAAGNNAAAGALEEQRSPVHDVVSGGGSPLDDGVRTQMESRMGHDFGDVRVHTGDAADASARSVSAHAYTVGTNIVFQRGAYEPGSTTGQTLLAHELTHVVQQRNGPVDGTPDAGGISVSSPDDRFEREAAANAEHVMAQPAPAAAPGSAAPAPAAAAVQRHAGHDHGDEQVQAAHDPALPAVQREGEEEEDVQASHDPGLAAVQREDTEEPAEEEAPG